MKKNIIIPTEKIEGDFNDFLEILGNQRIFFSGKYGIGKTYFLNNFFDIKNENFEVFHLYPVNYQISSNENIIDLIKYDLLLEILKKDENIFSKKQNELNESYIIFYEWFKNKYSFNDALQYTLSSLEHSVPFLQILSPFAKLGKPLRDVLLVDKEFQEFKKTLLTTEKDLLDKYLEATISKNIKEPDYIAHTIVEKVNFLKKDKKSILIIDDLDRIDPEHIFRILNVFSAHFQGEENIFDFDYVVLVGDINNIKSIFHHKYGINTDFEGYINKFFSTEPYILDNSKAILSTVGSIIESIKCDDELLKKSIGNSGYIKIFIVDIVSRLIKLNEISIRQIYKPTEVNFLALKTNKNTRDYFFDREVFARNTDVAVKLLISICGGDEKEVTKKITAILNNLDFGKNGRPYAAFLRVFLANKKVFPEFSSPGVHTYKNISFTIPNDVNQRSIEVVGGIPAETKLFFEILLEYIEKRGYEKEVDYDYYE